MLVACSKCENPCPEQENEQFLRDFIGKTGFWLVQCPAIAEIMADSGKAYVDGIEFVSHGKVDGVEIVSSGNTPAGFMDLLMSQVTGMNEQKKAGNCPMCGKSTHHVPFRDELSVRESKITGYCQLCQDEVFAPCDDE